MGSGPLAVDLNSWGALGKQLKPLLLLLLPPRSLIVLSIVRKAGDLILLSHSTHAPTPWGQGHHEESPCRHA